MNYPFWNVPYLGGGLVIAIVATLHVIIAQFGIGAGLFIAGLETTLLRHPAAAGSDGLRDFLRRYGRVVILLSFVLGVLSGVGIWFSISLATPRAASLLIHQFIWAWAAEWVCFTTEIAAGYLYYYGFDALTPARRCAVAWLYAASAWGSLFIVNGIIGFMLSPGRWLVTHRTLDGLFNPTFWPSLVLRTLLACALAGAAVVFAISLARPMDSQTRQHLTRRAAWFTAPLVLIVPISILYFKATPAGAQTMALTDALRITDTYLAVSALATLATLVTSVWLFKFNAARGHAWFAVPLLGIIILTMASLELVREGIRKPYLVYGYLYSTGWLSAEANPEESRELDTRGVLVASPWAIPPDQDAAHLTEPQKGAAVYRIECTACHNLGGVNDLAPLVRGWDYPRVSTLLAHLHELKPFMPPVAGTPEERQALAQYVWHLGESPPIKATVTAP